MPLKVGADGVDFENEKCLGLSFDFGWFSSFFKIPKHKTSQTFKKYSTYIYMYIYI